MKQKPGSVSTPCHNPVFPGTWYNGDGRGPKGYATCKNSLLATIQSSAGCLSNSQHCVCELNAPKNLSRQCGSSHPSPAEKRCQSIVQTWANGLACPLQTLRNQQSPRHGRSLPSHRAVGLKTNSDWLLWDTHVYMVSCRATNDHTINLSDVVFPLFLL